MSRDTFTTSIVSGIKHQCLGPFALPVVRSDYLKDGEIVVDVLLCSTHTPRAEYTFVIWQRHLKDDPRCDGCIHHTWKAILPDPKSETHPDPLAAWLAASRHVIANNIDGVYDETTG